MRSIANWPNGRDAQFHDYFCANNEPCIFTIQVRKLQKFTWLVADIVQQMRSEERLCLTRGKVAEGVFEIDMKGIEKHLACILKQVNIIDNTQSLQVREELWISCGRGSTIVRSLHFPRETNVCRRNQVRRETLTHQLLKTLARCYRMIGGRKRRRYGGRSTAM